MYPSDCSGAVSSGEETFEWVKVLFKNLGPYRNKLCQELEEVDMGSMEEVFWNDDPPCPSGGIKAA